MFKLIRVDEDKELLNLKRFLDLDVKFYVMNLEFLIEKIIQMV